MSRAGDTVPFDADPTERAHLAALRLSEAQLAEADHVAEQIAQTYDAAFGGIFGIGIGIGDAFRAAWAELRTLIEQRLCDCPRDPHHHWNCPATPIWAQTIRDLDTNPWTVFRPREMAAIGGPPR